MKSTPQTDNSAVQPDANTQPVKDSMASQFWAEAVRTEPRRDKFPWKSLLLGLLPAFLAIVLLLVPFLWLLDQANQNIVYVDQNGQMNAIQANREKPQTIGQPPLQLNESTQEQIAQVLPVLAWPEWSSDGNKLAATIDVNNNAQVVVFNPISKTTNVLSSQISEANKVVIPGNGWSPDNEHLLLLETDGSNAYLSLVDLSEAEPVIHAIPAISFDPMGGLDWHPLGEKVLVTTLPDGSSPSTLHFIDVESGRSSPFFPEDGQRLRTNAIWSSYGDSIAYIVPDLAQFQEGRPHAGALWLVNSDGSGARELVGEGLNMAPIWQESDPDYIYFTQQITGTSRTDYKLMRIRSNGPGTPEYVGDSYETFIDHPYDQAHFLQQSEGGELLISEQPTPSANRYGWTPDSIIRDTIQQSLPTLGMPAWSPNGRFLATTSLQNGKIIPTIHEADFQDSSPFSSVYDVMVVPASGWSNDSSTLALIESDGTNAYLTLVTEPFQASNASVYDFYLDSRTGLSWHPTEPKLLATGYTEEDPNPALFIVAPGAEPQRLGLNDNFAVHGDAAWSPDGTKIAYIATDVYTTGQDIIPGELRLFDTISGQTQPLLPDAQVIAPIWNAAEDTIYFIKVGGELGPFAFYRMAADGSTPPEYIGPANEKLVLFPLDRNRYLQWSDDGSQLLFLGEPSMPPNDYVAKAANAEVLSQIRDELPVLGVPSWSPDGTQFAGTVFEEGSVRAAIYQAQNGSPLSFAETTDLIVAPADGWAADSTQIALLRHDGVAASLNVMDTFQASLVEAQFPLDMRTGLSWHPDNNQIMVTSSVDEITPTLYIYNVRDNASSEFVPEDEQAVHADGVWSLNGRQVAYIAQETITPTVELDFLAGSLWVADANGKNARQLVPDGLNFAPIWDHVENRILFTRYLTETDTFDMYQVSLDEQVAEDSEEALLSYYGPGNSAFADYPFDRKSFLRWSPEGIRWLLPGAKQTLPLDYYMLGADGVSRKLETECNPNALYVVDWAPNNRGVLVACPSGDMALHWTDSQRNNQDYPDGLYPAWQP